MPVLDRRTEGSISTSMDDVARGIWARVAGDNPTPEKIAATADRIGTQLRAGLGRWIGVEGYRALLERSRALSCAKNPALCELSALGESDSATKAAVAAHGAGAVVAGMTALIAAMIELLGRIIGGDLAVRLVEQVAGRGPRGVETSQTNGGRNG